MKLYEITSKADLLRCTKMHFFISSPEAALDENSESYYKRTHDERENSLHCIYKYQSRCETAELHLKLI